VSCGVGGSKFGSMGVPGSESGGRPSAAGGSGTPSTRVLGCPFSGGMSGGRSSVGVSVKPPSPGSGSLPAGGLSGSSFVLPVPQPARFLHPPSPVGEGSPFEGPFPSAPVGGLLDWLLDWISGGLFGVFGVLGELGTD
jgi:hypothetical protein